MLTAAARLLRAARGLGRSRAAVALAGIAILAGAIPPWGGESSAQGTASCVVPPAGLTAWWPMNEPPGSLLVKDMTGLHNGIPQPGAIVAAPPGGPMRGSSPQVTPPAAVGDSLYFWDEPIHVEVPPGPGLDIDKGSFTIDAWVHPVLSHAQAVQPIVDKWDAPGMRGYALSVTQGKLTFIYGDGAQQFALAAPTALTPDAWSHIAVTLTRLTGGDYETRLFAGGVQVAMQTVTPSAAVANTLDLWLGGVRAPGAPFGEIALDDVEIYSRALSAAELQSLVAAGSAGKCGSETRVPRGRIPMLAADSGSPAGTLSTPSGVQLAVSGVTVVPGAGGFTLEGDVRLTNGTGAPLYVLTATGVERADLGANLGTQRQVCKHNFLWWHWDCFTYCTLPTEPQYLTPIHCPDADLRIVPSDGQGGPPPGDRAPADIVAGFVATADVARVALALGVDPATVRLLPPPLAPGATWTMRLAIPFDGIALPAAGAPLTVSFAVADDHGGIATAACDLAVRDAGGGVRCLAAGAGP